LRGQRHFAEAAHAYEKAAFSNGTGAELKVRTLLAAGECHDMLGDRQAAIRDYQEAIKAGPNTSRADTARRRLKSPYHGN
jgi:tetratricopeptide (TPR) repeat protein